jgi:hypothetical protein
MRPQVSKPARNGSNSPLFNANDIRLSHLPISRDGPDFFFQVQRDDFHNLAPVKHGVGKKTFYEQPQATKCDPSDQRQTDNNSAKDDRVEQKVG